MKIGKQIKANVFGIYEVYAEETFIEGVVVYLCSGKNSLQTMMDKI